MKFVFHLRDNPGIKLPAAKKSDVEIAEYDRGTTAKEGSPKKTKSPKAIKLNLETTTEIDGYSKSEAPPRELIIPFETEFAKIPREQDLEFLDPISFYECKIQTILLLQRIFPRYATIESKVNEDQDDTFLGIEIDLLIEVLRER